MSGHRPFPDLFAALPTDRRRRIDAEVELTLGEIERTESALEQASKFVIYRGQDGLFRWGLVAPNEQTLAESAQGFQDRSECLESIDRLRIASSTSAVEEAA
jgi:uncharacterized protein YegP (UPF0339 family)